MSTNCDPQENAILVQSTKIGTHENKSYTVAFLCDRYLQLRK